MDIAIALVIGFLLLGGWRLFTGRDCELCGERMRRPIGTCGNCGLAR
jgi:hypothetical protein